MDLNDEELVNKCLSGDKAAFGELVMRYQGIVRGLAYHLVGNFEDARDLAQDSFIRAYCRLTDLRDGMKFASWLRKITFSVCMNWLKICRRDQVVPMEADGKDINQPTDPAPSPVEQLEAAELRDAVLQAINQLPENYRLPLTLFHLDGLSYNKVADFLDLPVSTVKWRLHQARKKLEKGMLQMATEIFEEHKPDKEFTEETMEKISLLIADDDSAVRDALTKIFKDEGYDVHGAEDGIEALKHLEQRDCQIAIVDMKMPRLDGIELLEQIAQKHPNIVIIALTGGTMNIEQAVEAVKLGVHDFLEKPISPEGLDRALRRAVMSIRQGIRKHGTRSCPKCNRELNADWLYCPYDGTETG